MWLLLSITKPKEGIKTVPAQVELEDSVIVKRPVHGPDLLVPQFVLRPCCVAIQNLALGIEVGKSQSFQVLKQITQWAVLGQGRLGIALGKNYGKEKGRIF